MINRGVLKIADCDSEIESLSLEKHPAVLFSATRVALAMYAENFKLGLSFLDRMSRKDIRVLGSLYSHQIISHSQRRSPGSTNFIVQAMLESPFADVETIGAAHCYAYHLLYGQMTSEAGTLPSKGRNCRLGISKAAAHLVQHPSTYQAAIDTLVDLVDDEDAEVQRTIARVLHASEALTIEQIEPLLKAFAKSKAIRKDTSPLFYCFKRYERTLSSVPNIVLAIAEQLLDQIENSVKDIPIDRYETDTLSQPVVAIYERARESRDDVLANRCLDILDKMLLHQICSAREVLTQIRELQ